MLKQKCALITGATSGIGLACAERLASAGANLIITGRRKERLDSIAQKIEGEYSVKVLPLVMDVQNREGVFRSLEGLPSEFKDIDILVNIASTAGHVVYPGGSVYCASKHAVKAITETLRLELMDYDLRVSSIDPGMVDTEFSQVRFKGDGGKAASVYEGFDPLVAEDIAVMIGEMVIYATAQGDGKSVSRVRGII